MDNFLIIGGDKRQKVLYDLLVSEGINVTLMSETPDIKGVLSHSHIILPVPVSKDSQNVYCSNKHFHLSLGELTENLTPSQTVFGGGFNGELKKSFEQKGIKNYDFLADENFVVSNAYLTAQGSLRLLLENTEDYIVGSKILIIGFGRVASTLASLLKAVGAEVYIAARNHSQLQRAAFCGFKTLKLSDAGGCIYYFDYIFGTVPSNVLTSDNINLMRDDCIYFELASAPFTANKNDFIRSGKKYVFGGALPGKYLPVASGRLLRDCILQFISKQKE